MNKPVKQLAKLELAKIIVNWLVVSKAVKARVKLLAKATVKIRAKPHAKLPARLPVKAVLAKQVLNPVLLHAKAGLVSLDAKVLQRRVARIMLVSLAVNPPVRAVLAKLLVN